MAENEQTLTDDTKAILLLCGEFDTQNAHKQLSLLEYNTLVQWLMREGLRPADFLYRNLTQDAAAGTGLMPERLTALIGRGFELGCTLEEWQRKGIWICSRSDAAYPARYKKRLNDKTPPILYCCGERALFTAGGLAIVGSRSVDAEGEEFTRSIAAAAAASELPVISGGARGVDYAAMDAALAAGGCVTGVLADSLLKRSVERPFRQALAEKRLLLLSAQAPQSHFFVGNAMERNKLIYALADYALVVSAEEKKGGTWAGAKENLRNIPAVPVFVRTGQHVPAGNAALLHMGALPWPKIGATENLDTVLGAVQQTQQSTPHSAQLSLLPLADLETPPAASPSASIYDTVLPLLLKECISPQNSTDLAITLDVKKTQLDIWLQRAAREGKMRKLIKPVRYISA